MIMWFPLLLAALHSPNVAAMEREIAVTAACSAWFDSRESADPAAQPVDDDGVCFFGFTTDENSAVFVQTVESLAADKPLVVVVRSGGGEVTAAMSMAEALVPRTATVVVKRSCFSSCANYLFLAGDRRVVLADAVLAYHGGLFAQPEEYWAQTRTEFAAKMSEEEVNLSLEASKAYLTEGLTRQATFLASVEVDPRFFDWMQEFNASSKEDQIAACPVEGASLYLPSEAFLAARGVVIHSNDGPKSDAELSEVLTDRDAAGLVCYWD